jgi:plastocyanin
MLDRRGFLLTVGAGAVAGCSAEPAAERTTSERRSPAPPTTTERPDPPVVEMTDGLAFEPETVRVQAGGTVVWETVGAVAHSVTAYEERLPAGADYWASGGFDTESAARSNYPEGSVGSGETYSHTFETRGEHPYFCVPHQQQMKGTVIVE